MFNGGHHILYLYALYELVPLWSKLGIDKSVNVVFYNMKGYYFWGIIRSGKIIDNFATLQTYF